MGSSVSAGSSNEPAPQDCDILVERCRRETATWRLSGNRQREQKLAGINPVGCTICRGNELCKRGYEVAFTPDTQGNVPCRREGFASYESLGHQAEAATRKLFYVLAYMPAKKPNRFFIMSPQQATKLIQNEIESAKPGR